MTLADGSAHRPNLVVVLDRRGRARGHLDRIAPECSGADYVTRVEGPVGVRYRVGRMAPAVSVVDGIQAFLLGHVVSEGPAPEGEVPRMVGLVQRGEWAGLSGMQGVFALVAVDWSNARVSVVSDLLGVWPVYWAQRAGVTAVADCALTAARLGEVRVAPRAMAAWLVFRFTLGEDSLYEEAQRVPPASVGVFEGGSVRWREYWRPTAAEEPVGEAALWEGVCEDFRASVVRLLGPHESACLLLSGGLDSRFVLLTALRHADTRLDLVTVPYSSAERRAVDRLVGTLGLPCTRVQVRGAMLDAFDSLWHDHPDGYPMMRNLTYLPVVERGDSGPFLDGWMGEWLLGPPHVVFQDGTESSPEAAPGWLWGIMGVPTIDLLLRAPAADRVNESAREALAEQVDRIGPTTKACFTGILYTRVRRYVSNNFIQSRHLAHFLHPFFSRPLIERRLRHPSGIFARPAYRRMMAARFPEAGALPYADELPAGRDVHLLRSRRLRRALPELARFVVRERHFFRTEWILPRLSAYGLGSRGQGYIVEEVARLEAVRRSLGRRRIDFTYSEMFAG